MKVLKSSVIFYPSAICNLHCRYCNIDKNPALVEIDKMLEDSFNNTDYYINRLKKYYPNKDQLTQVQTWGAEPFIHMERMHNLLHQIIEYYPYFSSFFSSTNFSFPNWTDKVIDLLNIFGEYPHRKFYIGLQLSCDGPEYINDKGRGEGTTKKCLDNFNLLLQRLKQEKPSNVYINLQYKPTLDIESVKLLNSKEKIIEYYKFFEDNFLTPVLKSNINNLEIYDSKPNMGVPIPATKEDGLLFAEFCKNCSDIEKNAAQYFQYYTDIIPFASQCNIKYITYQRPSHLCGTGISFIGLLPNNLISTCNEGFLYILDKYKQEAKLSENRQTTIELEKYIDKKNQCICLTEKEYEQYERHMTYYMDLNNTATLSNIATFITILALSGQIDKKYTDFNLACKAAIFMHSNCGYCIKDNSHITRSITMQPIGMFRLILNGALDYIMKEVHNDI